jgi:hypothetical protein
LPEIVVRLPELPGIEIVVRTSFWRRATIIQAGKPLQRASGRRGPYVLPMPDGSQRTIKVVGTLNSSVVIDGRTYPIERRLRPHEYLLAAIPLVLAIPGFTGGALGFALGFGGAFANARLARSSARLPLRLLMMTGTSVLLLAIYIGVSIALMAALYPALAVGDCFDGASTATTADKLTALACNGAHDSEVVGRPAYAPAASAFPGQGALDAFAATACPAAFATYVGRPFDPAKDGMTYNWPTSEGWDASDRELVCLVVAPSGQKFTGPIAGH